MSYVQSCITAAEKKLTTGQHKKFITHTFAVTQSPDGSMSRTPIGEIVDYSDSLRGQIGALKDLMDIPKVIKDIADRKKKYEENPNKGAE